MPLSEVLCKHSCWGQGERAAEVCAHMLMEESVQVGPQGRTSHLFGLTWLALPEASDLALQLTGKQNGQQMCRKVKTKGK